MYREFYDKKYDSVFDMLSKYNYSMACSNSLCLGYIKAVIESDDSDSKKLVEIDAVIGALSDYGQKLTDD